MPCLGVGDPQRRASALEWCFEVCLWDQLLSQVQILSFSAMDALDPSNDLDPSASLPILCNTASDQRSVIAGIHGSGRGLLGRHGPKTDSVPSSFQSKCPED